jgi:putative addiction module component (TIGR02574 family)
MAKPAVDLTKLTSTQKLDLIDELWVSLDEADLPLSGELKSELDRRLERFDREGPVGRSWQDVHADLAKRAK